MEQRVVPAITTFCVGPCTLCCGRGQGARLAPQGQGTERPRGRSFIAGFGIVPSGPRGALLVGEPWQVRGATAWAPSALAQALLPGCRGFWSLFKESGRGSTSLGAAPRPAVAAAAQADTQQSSPLKAGTAVSQKQPAEGTLRPRFTATHPGLYLKTRTLG